MSEINDVLVVEDSRTQAMTLVTLLKDAGLTVRLAGDGIQALEMVGEQRPTLVLTDVVMPRMDGYALCAALKASPETASIPVVLLTSLSDPAEVINALECGADSFLTKPYDPQFLVERVGEILANARLDGSPLLPDGSVKVIYSGVEHVVRPRRDAAIGLLLSTYSHAVVKNARLESMNQELNQSLETIRSLQNDYVNILTCSTDAIIVFDGQSVVRYANPAAGALFEQSPDVLKGARFPYATTPGQVSEVVLNHSGRGRMIVEVQVSRSHWEGEDAFLATLSDVTEKVRIREHLQTLAYQDALTGLVNRRGFFLLAEQAARTAQQDGKQFLVFFLDVDGLKTINDTLGHDQGDAVICDAADVLRATFRASDVLARMGGDEFAVLAADANMATATMLEHRLQAHIDQVNDRGSRPYRLSISVGTVEFNPKDGVDLNRLVSNADELMYQNKKAKKGK